MEKTEITAKVQSKLCKAEKRLIALVAALTLQVAPYVYAADNTTPAATGDDVGFNKTLDTVLSWGSKAGLAVTLVGGIMFAFAFKNNDAEQKTSAIQTMIAGVIVAALCGLGRSQFGL